MTNHIEWETLNDYVDDRLSPHDRASVAEHLGACEECRDTVDRLREMLAEATHSTESIEPPAETWEAIRSEVDLRKVVPLPSRVPMPRNRTWMRVAAVIAIIAASSLTTALFMREKKQLQITSLTVDTTPSGVVPVTAVEIERNYAETVRTLTAALDASRSTLAPETVEAVEQSLRTIDEAIAEARNALMHDPASSQLRGMLTRSYEQKVDLLRRASGRAKAT